MTRKRRRSGKHRSNAAGLTALALCFTSQLQLQAPTTPAAVVAEEPSPGFPTADDAAANAANLVFSPVSVYAALAMLAAGACGGTLQELLDALGGDSRDDLVKFARHAAERALADRSQSGGPTIAFACGVWLDAAWELLPDFRDAAAASFNAEARVVDFSSEPEKAVGKINGSLAAVTNKHIDSIVDPSSVNTLTTLVLTSTIYFEGRWESPFPEAQKVVDKFHRLDGSTADVSFMCSSRSQYIAVRNGYKVLKLPYISQAPPPAPARRRNKGSSTPSESDRAPEYSMCVFLPDERNGLPGLVKKMASGAGFWHYRLPTSQVPVGALRLPKFKLSVSGSVREALSDGMGIKSAFVVSEADLADMAAAKRDEDEGEADLADMTAGKREEDDDAAGTPLYVADVCHKAVLEVNEGGTLRGATSSYMLCGASAVMDQPATVDFVGDHPFVFFVIEEVSRAIVFALLDASSTLQFQVEMVW